MEPLSLINIVTLKRFNIIMKSLRIIQSVLILSTLLLIVFFFSSEVNAYTKDQAKLIPLEKEILLEWVNENCYENHKTWEDLINDGRIKCKNNNKPESFSTLKPVKHYISFSNGEFRFNSKDSYVLYFIQLILFLIICSYISNKSQKNRIYRLFVKCFLFVTFFEIFQGYLYFADKMPYTIKTIYDAAEENNLSMVKHFVEEQNVNPNAYKKSFGNLLPSKNGGKEKYASALDLAVYRRNFKIAAYLANYTPEINANYAYEDGQTVHQGLEIMI